MMTGSNPARPEHFLCLMATFAKPVGSSLIFQPFLFELLSLCFAAAVSAFTGSAAVFAAFTASLSSSQLFSFNFELL